MNRLARMIAAAACVAPLSAGAQTYASAFADYQPYVEPVVADWKAINAAVAAPPGQVDPHAGHHMAAPAEPQAAPHGGHHGSEQAPGADPHAGHGMPAKPASAPDPHAGHHLK